MSTNVPPLISTPNAKDPSTELKSAAQLYLLYAFTIGLPWGIVIGMSDRKPDNLGVAIASCVGAYIFLVALTGTLLLMRKRVGLYRGWVIMPLILISVPIGTLIGAFIILKMNNPKVKALLT